MSVNKEQQKEYRRRTNYMRIYDLKRRYNITLEQYHLMVINQSGKCAICRKEFTQTPCIDHCHETNKVRGLLCRWCNFGVGFIDNYEQEAKNYLESELPIAVT